MHKVKTENREILALKANFIPTQRANITMELVMLLTHVGFAFWYAREGLPILFGYNIISIAVFLLGTVLAVKNVTKPLWIMNFAEIYVFMTMNLLFLGWDFGFQYYCFGFLVSALIVDFYASRRQETHWLTKAFIGFDILFFVAMRLWLYWHPPLYRHVDGLSREALYLSNALLTLLLILSLVNMYMQTVYTLESKLRHAAVHDALTGLFNRGKMQEILDESASTAALAILDIDHFKEINDTYGHAAGDAVLVRLAELLRQLDGESVIVARWGGEEFLLLCTKNDTGRAICEDLRMEVERTPVVYDGKHIRWTVTIGFAEETEADSMTSLLRIADEKLYEGKRIGRNRVVA